MDPPLKKRMRFITLDVSDKGSRASFQNAVSSRFPGNNDVRTVCTHCVGYIVFFKLRDS
jgi:hypothetical protein